MHYTFAVHKCSALSSLIVLLSPFVPQRTALFKLVFFCCFLFFYRYQALRSNETLSETSLWHFLSTHYLRCISAPPCAAVHVIEVELNFHPDISPRAFCLCRRSCITLRPRWRSTTTTRSSWSSRTRNCSTWRLWGTKSTSRKPRRNTSRSPRRQGRLVTRWEHNVTLQSAAEHDRAADRWPDHRPAMKTNNAVNGQGKNVLIVQRSNKDSGQRLTTPDSVPVTGNQFLLAAETQK